MYHVALCIAGAAVACICGAIALLRPSSSARAAAGGPSSAAFRRFQLEYLSVYFLMTAADWLQGPYVYALYEAYGFERSVISQLYVSGYACSMLVGPMLGSLADRHGRRRFCLLYVACFAASTATKHVKHVWVIALGRLSGGVCTSLLMSVFESWMCCEHTKRGFPPEWLSRTFLVGSFGNSAVAIASGLAAHWVSAVLPLSGGPLFYYGGLIEARVCALVPSAPVE